MAGGMGQQRRKRLEMQPWPSASSSSFEHRPLVCSSCPTNTELCLKVSADCMKHSLLQIILLFKFARSNPQLCKTWRLKFSVHAHTHRSRGHANLMKKNNKMCVVNLITSEAYSKHTKDSETLHGTEIRHVPICFRELRPKAQRKGRLCYHSV